MQINKWKIFGYTVTTWFLFSVLARILVELEPRPYFTIIDGQGIVWGWMSLFMGIYLATRFKKWIELVGGIVLFFICTLPVIGMFVGIGYFARAYVKLEEERKAREVTEQGDKRKAAQEEAHAAGELSQKKIMAAVLVLCVVLIGFWMLAPRASEPILTAEQIEQQIMAHQDSVQSFTCNIVMTSNNETMIMDYAYKQPNLIRMEYTEPSEMVGQVMVSNGTYIWMYDPAENIVKTANIPESAQTNRSRDALFLKDLLDTCTIVPNGTGTVSGRQCYRITATPDDASMPRSVEVWLDKWNWMPLKIETYQNGELLMSMEYRDVAFNVDIPNSTFEFEIPEGATVESTDETAAPATMTIEEAQAEVSFDIKEPVYLPPGYEMESVMVTPISASEDGVVLVYTNATDENMLSAQLTVVQLVESAYDESAEPMMSPEGNSEAITIGDGYDCTMTTMETPFGNTVVLQWNDGALDYMLASPLDREAMIDIASSI